MSFIDKAFKDIFHHSKSHSSSSRKPLDQDVMQKYSRMNIEEINKAAEKSAGLHSNQDTIKNAGYSPREGFADIQRSTFMKNFNLTKDFNTLKAPSADYGTESIKAAAKTEAPAKITATEVSQPYEKTYTRFNDGYGTYVAVKEGNEVNLYADGGDKGYPIDYNCGQGIESVERVLYYIDSKNMLNVGDTLTVNLSATNVNDTSYQTFTVKRLADISDPTKSYSYTRIDNFSVPGKDAVTADFSGKDLVVV